MKQKKTIRKKRSNKKNTRRLMKGGYPYISDSKKEHEKYNDIIAVAAPSIEVWKTAPAPDNNREMIRIILVRHGTGFHNDYQSKSMVKSAAIEKKKNTIKTAISGKYPDKYKYTSIDAESSTMNDIIKKNNDILRGVKEIDVYKYMLICETLKINNENMTPYDKLTDPELTHEGKLSITKMPDPNNEVTSARSLLTTLNLYKEIHKIPTYVSPLKRTIQTAYILSNPKYNPETTDDSNDIIKLSEFLNKPNIRIDKDCREQIESKNIFDKLRYNPDYYPGDSDKYNYYDDLFYTYKGEVSKEKVPEEKVDIEFLFDENLTSMLIRGKNFIERIISEAKEDDETIIVVTHSGFLYGLLHGVFKPMDSDNEENPSLDRKFTAWFKEGEARDFYFKRK